MLFHTNIIAAACLAVIGSLSMAQAQPQRSLVNDDMCSSKDGDACAVLGGYCAHGCEDSITHVCMAGLCKYGSKSSKTGRATGVQSEDNALRRLSGKTNKAGKTADKSGCECLVPLASEPTFEPDSNSNSTSAKSAKSGSKCSKTNGSAKSGKGLNPTQNVTITSQSEVEDSASSKESKSDKSPDGDDCSTASKATKSAKRAKSAKSAKGLSPTPAPTPSPTPSPTTFCSSIIEADCTGIGFKSPFCMDYFDTPFTECFGSCPLTLVNETVIPGSVNCTDPFSFDDCECYCTDYCRDGLGDAPFAFDEWCQYVCTDPIPVNN